VQRFADRGIDVRFTQLDVRIPVLNGAATPLTEDYRRKPTWSGIADVLK